MTTDSRRQPRRMINLPRTADDMIERLTTLTGQDYIGDTILNICNRYFAIIHRATPKIPDNELCAIFDALGETWTPEPASVRHLPRDVMDAIHTDRLDNKWSFDADQLRTRLERTSFPERMAIGELARAYWTLTTPNTFPQATIQRIRELSMAPRNWAAGAPESCTTCPMTGGRRQVE